MQPWDYDGGCQALSSLHFEAHGEGGQIVGTLKPRVPASSEETQHGAMFGQTSATDYLRSSWQLQTTPNTRASFA